jgi:hypothetical protein
VEGSRWLLVSSRAVLDRPHPVFSGGTDPQPDETMVHERVRGLIDAGILPHFHSGRLRVGPCMKGHDCTICGLGITVGEQEMEILSSTGAVVIYTHRRCFDMWSREAADGDGPPRSESSAPDLR